MRETDAFFLQKDHVQKLIKFVFWGGVNTGASFSVYCAFVYAGVHIYLASLFSLVFGVFLGHFLHKNNVFKSTQEGTIYKYAAVWFGLYLINILLLGLFVKFGFNNYAAGGIAALMLVPVSFMIQKLVVFR